MKQDKITFSNINEYIAAQPASMQPGLQELRQLIQKAAPKATETISYSMPAFTVGKVIAFFAAAKNHFGFYPHPKAIEAFKDRLTKYECSKGAIRLPNTQPLPVKLITDIVKFNVKDIQLQLELKAAAKKEKKK